MAIAAFISYLALEKKYSRHTVKAYESDLQAFSDFCQNEYELDSIDQTEYPLIRNWIVTLVGQEISNRSINRKITALKSYFKFLMKIGAIRINPLAKHKALKTSKKIEVPFSEIEMSALLDEVEFDQGFEGSRDQLIISLFYSTGIRRAELINLRLEDLDLEAQVLKVLGKRDKERLIPILDKTKDLFSAYLSARSSLNKIHDPKMVFLTSRGNKIYETLVYRIINKYLSLVSSKVKKSPHILRHTFATHLLNQGADLNSVKELLGHASLASTQVYTHNSIAELKKVHAMAHPRNKKN